MLQNRLLGWHPGLFQQPALFVLTSIWLGHGSPWRFSCHWQTGRRANGSLGAGKVHNLSKVLNFPSWRKHVKCRLYRFVEFQSDKDVTAVLEKPAQSGKVASNSLEWCNGSLYPCCPSCPPCDGITFPKHDGCVDEKCMLTIECQGLSSRTKVVRLRSAAGPPLSWRTATQRYCTNPGHCWFKRMSHGSSESHVTSSRRFKKQTTLKRFQGSFIRLAVRCSDTFLSNFRMSCGERRLNQGWSANNLRSCQLRMRFCPGHDVIAQMLSWRRDISPAHSSTLGCWALVHEQCVQLLYPH